LNRGHTSYMAGCTRVLPTRLREGFLHRCEGARTCEPIFLSLQQPPLSITSKFHSILPLRLKIGSRALPFDHRHHHCERHNINDPREVYLVHKQSTHWPLETEAHIPYSLFPDIGRNAALQEMAVMGPVSSTEFGTTSGPDPRHLTQRHTPRLPNKT
jgi:hypothetical protein